MKGAAGYDLPETELDSFGIPLDRRWMLVDRRGYFVSQRTHPRLALARTSPGEAGICVEASGMPALNLRSPESPPEPESDPWQAVGVHKDRTRGLAVGKEADEWFSRVLDDDLRTVYMPKEVIREVDPRFAPGHRVSFADAYPLLLASESSLADLNARMAKPMKMLRFRPNLIVVGSDPWEEDTWRVVEIGTTRLDLVKPCARCQVPQVNPATAMKGREPLRTLSRFRMYDGKVYFGQNAVFPQTGGLRVGDEVRIKERGEARPPL